LQCLLACFLSSPSLLDAIPLQLPPLPTREPNMAFTARKKIAKEAGVEPTELEEQVAQVRQADGSFLWQWRQNGGSENQCGSGVAFGRVPSKRLIVQLERNPGSWTRAMQLSDI
jgi:hypothetical protein